MNLLRELKRRNVFRAGAFYAAATWLLVQVATQVFPFFHIAEWVVRWIVIAAIIGFPCAIAFAWFFEFTPSGLKRESEIDPADSIAHSTSRKLNVGIFAVMAVAIVLLLTDRFVLHKDLNEVAAIPTKSIAVLPLTNESGNQDEQYFSDGLSDDLITALSQFAGLKVISRNSAFKFRDSKDDGKTIGMKLGVAHLLEGSVQHAGDAVRISARLINAADGSLVWSQQYDRPYQDLFKLQDDITTAVAGALQAQLLGGADTATQSDRPPSGDLAAYNAYLQGKFYSARPTEADFRKAIEAYTTATRLDPQYARAYARLSITWVTLAAAALDGVPAQQAIAQARAAADTALALEPNLAAAHVARGTLLLAGDFNWTGAEAQYRRAVQLAPNDGSAKASLSALLATLGQPDQAVEQVRQALLTDPLHASWYYALAGYLGGLGRLDEADQAVRKAIELQPTAAAFHTRLAIIAIQRGDAKGALAAAQQEPAEGVVHESALALAQQVSGNRADADAALQTLIDTYSDGAPYQIAQVYALRKDAENMFVWLDRAWASRDSGIGLLLYDPLILRYKDDPRFAAFCHKVELPTTTTAKALP